MGVFGRSKIWEHHDNRVDTDYGQEETAAIQV